MIKKNTDEDISEEEFNAIIKTFIDNKVNLEDYNGKILI